jgi:hypothetical protein
MRTLLGMAILVGWLAVGDDGLAVDDLDVAHVRGQAELFAIFGRGHHLLYC